MGSQIVGENQSRLPGRRTVVKVSRGGRRASDRAKKTIHRFRIGFRRERRASSLPCLSLGLGDYRRDMSGSRDISLAIFITTMSGSKSLTSFTYRNFHFRTPPGFRLAFDGAERNGEFGCIIPEMQREQQQRKEKETSILLQKNSESRSKKQKHPNEPSEN